jgi:isopenicillin N synthase-like dioxygenase
MPAARLGDRHFAESIVHDIVTAGYSRPQVPEEDELLLQQVLEAAPEFFGRDLDAKLRHAGQNKNFGYRQLGLEFSRAAERPDLNESFAVWSDRLDLIPMHLMVGPLLRHIVRWQERLQEVVAEILARLVEVLGGQGHKPPRFARASYVQVNSSVAAPSEREFLQDCHEDGHLLTILHASQPGLEINCAGHAEPIAFLPNELLVLPGSMLTLISDNQVPPLFHRVRSLGVVGRVSVMYFVNPQIDEPVRGWAKDGSQTKDLRETIRNRPIEFGLPKVPLL